MKNTIKPLGKRRSTLPSSARQTVVVVLVIVLLGWPLPDAAHAAAGDLDNTFDSGKVTANIRLSESASAVAIQPDGRIVAAGFTIGPGASSFALVRYNIDGALSPESDSLARVDDLLSLETRALRDALHRPCVGGGSIERLKPPDPR